MIVRLKDVVSKAEMQEMHDALKYIESKFEAVADRIHEANEDSYNEGRGSAGYKHYSSIAHNLSNAAFTLELEINDGRRAPQNVSTNG